MGACRSAPVGRGTFSHARACMPHSSDMLDELTTRTPPSRSLPVKLAAFRSPGYSIATVYKIVAILVLNTIVLIVGLELVAGAGYKIKRLTERPEESLAIGEGSAREHISYYGSQDWALQ